jgi:hypothetical protein
MGLDPRASTRTRDVLIPIRAQVSADHGIAAAVRKLGFRAGLADSRELALRKLDLQLNRIQLSEAIRQHNVKPIVSRWLRFPKAAEPVLRSDRISADRSRSCSATMSAVTVSFSQNEPSMLTVRRRRRGAHHTAALAVDLTRIPPVVFVDCCVHRRGSGLKVGCRD